MSLPSSTSVPASSLFLLSSLLQEDRLDKVKEMASAKPFAMENDHNPQLSSDLKDGPSVSNNSTEDDDIIIIEPVKKPNTEKIGINMYSTDGNTNGTNLSTAQMPTKPDLPTLNDSEIRLKKETGLSESQAKLPAERAKKSSIPSGQIPLQSYSAKEVIDVESLDNIQPQEKTQVPIPALGLQLDDNLTIQQNYANNQALQQLLLSSLAMPQSLGQAALLANPLLAQGYNLLSSYGINQYNPLLGMMNGFGLGNSLSNPYLLDLTTASYLTKLQQELQALQAQQLLSQLQAQAQLKTSLPQTQFPQNLNSLTVPDKTLTSEYSLTLNNTIINESPADSLNKLATTAEQKKGNEEAKTGNSYTIWSILERKAGEGSNNNSNNKKEDKDNLDSVLKKRGREKEIATATSSKEMPKNNKTNKKFKDKINNIMDLDTNNKDDEKSEKSEGESLASKNDKSKKTGNSKKERSTRSRAFFELTPEHRPTKKERKMNKLQLMKDGPSQNGSDSEQASTSNKIKKGKVAKSDNNDAEEEDEDEITETPVGESYQAVITPFALNGYREPRNRVIRSVWNPEEFDDSRFKEFLNGLEQIIGESITNHEACVKLLKKNQMNIEKIYEQARKNEAYYKNLLKANSYQAILRQRNSQHN